MAEAHCPGNGVIRLRLSVHTMLSYEQLFGSRRAGRDGQALRHSVRLFGGDRHKRKILSVTTAEARSSFR